MPTYTQPTELEFDATLPAEKGWGKDQSGREVVYLWNLKSDPDIQIKVFSSLALESGRGRGVGEDAIRVCAINSRLGKGLVKTSRINRTPGWSNRLHDKILEVIKTAKERSGRF